MADDDEQLDDEQRSSEFDLPTAYTRVGEQPRRTMADLTDDERAYNRAVFGVTHHERYGKRGHSCVTYCLNPGQRRRGARCPACYGKVQVRSYAEADDIEPSATRAERIAAWAGGWVGAFIDAMLFPFRVGRAHTSALVKDILQEAIGAGLQAEVDGLSDILQVVEALEDELRAIRNAVERQETAA